MTVKSRYMTEEIAVHTIGEGNNILLLIHAFPANSQMFAKLTDFLPEGWKAIFPDLPGFGQSKTDEGTEILTMSKLARVIDSIIPSEYHKLVIGGVSMGGYITMAYIREFPEKADGYILANTRDQEDSDGGKGRREVVDMIKEGNRDQYITDLFPKLLGEDNLTDETIKNDVKSMISSTSDKAIVQTSLGMGERPDSRELMSQVSKSILLITGSQDVITGIDVMEEMHNKYQNSQFQVLDKAGHYSPVEQPYQFGKAIKNFLQKLKA